MIINMINRIECEIDSFVGKAEALKICAKRERKYFFTRDTAALLLDCAIAHSVELALLPSDTTFTSGKCSANFYFFVAKII